MISGHLDLDTGRLPRPGPVLRPLRGPVDRQRAGPAQHRAERVSGSSRSAAASSCSCTPSTGAIRSSSRARRQDWSSTPATSCSSFASRGRTAHRSRRRRDSRYPSRAWGERLDRRKAPGKQERRVVARRRRTARNGEIRDVHDRRIVPAQPCRIRTHCETMRNGLRGGSRERMHRFEMISRRRVR